ncbi:MAG: glycoside hydrolase family 95 protein [Verrucomicrobiota bacterium]
MNPKTTTTLRRFTLGIALLLPSAASFAADPVAKIHYAKPAESWSEALPIGNGRLGAMVFGKVDEERIQMNEDTLWTGGPHDYTRPGGAKVLPEVRKLISQGKYKDALLLADQHMSGSPQSQQAYQPFADLFLKFEGSGEPADYRRSLDMASGIATTRYKLGNVTYTREVFASFPDQIIVVHLSSDQPGAISFTARLESPHPHEASKGSDDTLVMNGQVPAHEAAALLGPWDKPGTRFEARLRVAHTDGKVSVSEKGLSVAKAGEVTLHYAAATAFENFKDVSGDPAAKNQTSLKAVEGISRHNLRERHVADHQPLFERVRLELGNGGDDSIPTDERLRAVQSGKDDPFLAAQVFQFGRYLMMASSRPGSQPANLQGIWNQDLRPAWGSKWTININAPMNYWLAESCNLSECHEPLFSLLEDLREPGRTTAREVYDCDGFVVHHNTDLWRATAVDTNFYFGGWPMGAAWLSTHLWEHYDFTRDKAFLEKAWPTMREAAEFFVDFLIKDENGHWVTSPSISFEQSFVTEGEPDGRVCAGPTMDMMILRKFFAGCIGASKAIGKDEDFRKQLVSIRDNLAPTKIHPDTGRLQEWRNPDWKPAYTHDGQLAHLWGLCPGSEISPVTSPDLATAAEKTLRHRGFRYGSWTSGKSLNYWARLHDSEEYGKGIDSHLRGHTLPNLLSSFDNGLFQIDGNFGMTASVAESLMQSHAGVIDLLPALPSAWSSGSVSGLRARGGFEVDLSWSQGKLTKVTIRSKTEATCKVRYGDRTTSLETKNGGSHTLDGQLAPL